MDGNRRRLGFTLVYLAFAALCIAWVVALGVQDERAIITSIPCPFHELTGYQCPGCGLQHSVRAVLHGNVKEAFAFNPLFPFLLTLFGYVVASTLAKEVFRKPLPSPSIPTPLLVLATCSLFAFWIARNLL